MVGVHYIKGNFIATCINLIGYDSFVCYNTLYKRKTFDKICKQVVHQREILMG